MHGRRRHRHLLLLLTLLFAALPAHAGLYGTEWISGGGRAAKRAVIAMVPDPQNYCSTDTSGNEVSLRYRPLAMEQLDSQVEDIVRLHPDFAVVLGDLTDTTGGPLTLGRDLNDDPNSAGTDKDFEWTCFRSHVYDPLRAAGIPVFLVTGNHDSCVDFERHFPRSEWMALPYAYAAENEANACGASFNLPATEQRAAIMPTPIGSICVVGADYDRDPLTTIQTWVETNHGCGANLPTLVVRHSDADSILWINNAALPKIFATAEGHFVLNDPEPAVTMFDPGPLVSSPPASIQYAHLGINMQELHLNGYGSGCADPANYVGGACMHTGLSWYGLFEIEPKTNTLRWQARAPWLKGRNDSSDPARYTVGWFNGVGAKEIHFVTPWCTRFPGGPAC